MIDLIIKVPRQITVDCEGDIYRVIDETGKVWKEGKDASTIIQWAVDLVHRHGISPDLDGTYALSEPIVIPNDIEIQSLESKAKGDE